LTDMADIFVRLHSGRLMVVVLDRFVVIVFRIRRGCGNPVTALVAGGVKPENEPRVTRAERAQELRAVADRAAAGQQVVTEGELASLPGREGGRDDSARRGQLLGQGQPPAAAFAVPAAACGRTAKAASPIRQMRPNGIRDTSMS